MAVGDQNADVVPIDDGEILYRRVPVSMSWYDPGTNALDPQAFGPRKDDQGLSVSRARFASEAKAAAGQPGKDYYLAKLRVQDLRARGIDVVPQPLLSDGRIDHAHAELSQLTGPARKNTETLERMRILARELAFEVVGPFSTPGDNG